MGKAVADELFGVNKKKSNPQSENFQLYQSNDPHRLFAKLCSQLQDFDLQVTSDATDTVAGTPRTKLPKAIRPATTARSF